MPQATFVCADGTRRELDVAIGTSLMRAATDNGIDGIVGDCGGAMSCATCHVFVEDGFSDRLPAMAPNEDQILDYTAAGRQPNSRLACQIVMSESIAGIVVRVADPQV
ncbi:2Fe-2S iron-sulfur cluster-binding protein [Ramlibacter sp.]|uniref:2Fe-2S iron-sulfur cluster-binding protein n=1 Tax=Ramlibacter sp. TaxID=1917967 RepID=UPI0035AEC4C3